MAKRMTQAQKKKKELESQVTSDMLDEQIEAFLKGGGKIEKVAQGESGMRSVADRKSGKTEQASNASPEAG